jgi:hypothetical protein
VFGKYSIKYCNTDCGGDRGVTGGIQGEWGDILQKSVIDRRCCGVISDKRKPRYSRRLMFRHPVPGIDVQQKI